MTSLTIFGVGVAQADVLQCVDQRGADAPVALDDVGCKAGFDIGRGDAVGQLVGVEDGGPTCRATQQCDAMRG